MRGGGGEGALGSDCRRDLKVHFGEAMGYPACFQACGPPFSTLTLVNPFSLNILAANLAALASRCHAQ